MLFRRKIPRSCSYCKHGAKLDGALVLCTKRGVMPEEHACRKFSYDPCKRVPKKQGTLDFKKYSEEDFSL